MHHVEQFGNTRDLVEHDPTCDRFGVEDRMQALRLRAQLSSERAGTQIEDPRIREPLKGDGGLSRAPGPQEQGGPGGRRETASYWWSRVNEGHS